MFPMMTVNWASRRMISALQTVGILAISLICLFTLGNYSISELDTLPFQHQRHKEIPQNRPGLDLKSLKNPELTYHSDLDAYRFMANNAWRPSDAYKQTLSSSHRVESPKLAEYDSKAEYLKQSLVADYAKHSEKLFLMVKTGATVMWQRLPIHLVTTLTRVPNFALYADTAASVGGHEVIDILQNVTEKTKDHQQFKMYRQLQQHRSAHGAINPASTTLDGGWDLDKFKNLPMLLHAYRTAPHLDWFAFMDADSYLAIDNLMDYLKKLNPEEPLYIGCPIMYGETMFNHGGSGVVLSRKALEITVGAHPEWVTDAEDHTLDVCCGDYMVAHALLKANVSVAARTEHPFVREYFQGESYQKMGFQESTWCQKVVSFHHLEASDVEVLWEYERLIGPERRKHITYYDMYRDFVAPYLHSTLLDWDNDAHEKVISKEEDEKERQEHGKDHPDEEALKLSEPRPWSSQDTCRQECANTDWCLSWRYLPKEAYCGLDGNVRLGGPHFSWLKYPQKLNREGVVSGYQLDKVRDLRRRSTCDSLYKSSNEAFANDPYKEGWYLRKKQQDAKPSKETSHE